MGTEGESANINARRVWYYTIRRNKRQMNEQEINQEHSKNLTDGNAKSLRQDACLRDKPI